MDDQELEKSFNGLLEKAVIKLRVFDRINEVFFQFKDVTRVIESEYRKKMEGLDARLLPEVRIRGNSEIEMKIASDLLVFSLLPEIYEFDRYHLIWKTEYVQNNPFSTYCGVINIYNFLYDSLRLNRSEDLGYLIARIFVNSDGFFYVEGKRQVNFLSKQFGTSKIDAASIKSIIETSVNYALGFDLLVPPYDDVKIISVEVMNHKIQESKLKTGKRLGYKFNSDDIN